MDWTDWIDTETTRRRKERCLSKETGSRLCGCMREICFNSVIGLEGVKGTMESK